jgi:hypothetical protein
MTKKQIIEVAEQCGLTYAGDDDYGEPEFIGKDKEWDKFNERDLTEVIEEPDFTGATNEDR